MLSRVLSLSLLLAVALAGIGMQCASGPRVLTIYSPADGLVTTGAVFVEVDVPPGTQPGSVEILIDGNPVVLDQVDSERASVTVASLADGEHTVEARATTGVGAWVGSHGFHVVTFENPDQCEVLNQVACSLPYPSSRFLEPADTETGVHVKYGANSLPIFARFVLPAGVRPIDPVPFEQNDGFSPTTHVLMHFPAGVDVVASDAPRIDPTSRTYDGRGLDADSPTLLIDWETGEAINHFVENDVRPNAAPDRVLTFLRPGESLTPGHRYIVAVRGLRDVTGQTIQPEIAFEAIRDGRPTDIPELEDTRERVTDVIERLQALRPGLDAGELQLAFDFTVMSDHNLTHEMVSMRDQALAWTDAQIDAGTQTFTVDSVNEVNPGCQDPNVPIWREIRGTFQVPLFLDRDLFLERTEVSFLMRDPSGTPVWNTLTNAPYGLAIPCSALQAPLPKAILGHGLFGEGPGLVLGITNNPGFAGFDRVAAATNWSGLSREETRPDLLQSFIFKVNGNPDLFEALPDRLRQGMTNTLVLTRLLERGAFNLAPEVRTPSGAPTIDPAGDTTYIGISLGGVMGTMLAATTPDITRFNVDVPAISFPFLLYRSTQFSAFEALQLSLNADSMDQQIAIELTGSLWVRGEPAGYVGHITGNTLAPLPGVPPKQMLVTASLHDQQVANLGTQLLARSLRIPTLEGSVWTGLPGIPDAVGPQTSGVIYYDTGALDVNNPAHIPFIPPVGNEQGIQNRCDPHGQRTGIPASVAQLLGFWNNGVIENFCTDDGVCNASNPSEINGGAPTPCDPLL